MYEMLGTGISVEGDGIGCQGNTDKVLSCSVLGRVCRAITTVGLCLARFITCGTQPAEGLRLRGIAPGGGDGRGERVGWESELGVEFGGRLWAIKAAPTRLLQDLAGDAASEMCSRRQGDDHYAGRGSA